MRILHVGDIVYQNEKITTDSSNSKVIITQTDGKDITLLGKDTITLDQSTSNNESFGNETVADISALQQATLNGTDLNLLEETAAGGGEAGVDGVSLSATSFIESGHISNVNANYGNLPDNTDDYVRNYSAISGGGLDIQDATNTIIPPTPTVKFTEDENGDHLLNKDENNIDGDQNKTTVRITVPNNGSVEVGDTLNIVIYKPNGSSESRSMSITQQIIDNGHVLTDVPVENDKKSVATATITNKYGNTGGEGRDTVTTDTTHTAKIKR